ncbi:MAG TPA: hypothetical protein VFQ32_13150 [Ktedonobacterales bacterium]|nr:hypothetical protein [Ktedonobacterales bacterium]
MLDPRLWNTHIHQREQQFMREADRDRVAHEYRRAHSPLAVALRDALAIVRARITGAAARAGTEPAKSQALVVSDKSAVSILSEAEKVVRSYTGSSSDCTCCPC